MKYSLARTSAACPLLQRSENHRSLDKDAPFIDLKDKMHALLGRHAAHALSARIHLADLRFPY
jgi:hypothetical protein